RDGRDRLRPDDRPLLRGPGRHRSGEHRAGRRDPAGGRVHRLSTVTSVETVSPVAVSVAGAARPAVLRFLRDQGTDTIDHPGGKLFDRLFRTAVTLAEWRVPDPLVAAGLVHAVYGTDGFPVALRPIDARDEVRALIGDEAEQIVY